MKAKAAFVSFLFPAILLLIFFWRGSALEFSEIALNAIIAAAICIFICLKWRRGDKEDPSELSPNDVEDTFS